MSEQIYLHSAGTLPGIPGVLGPGLYEVDYDARIVTPIAMPTVEDVPPTTPIETYTEYYATQPLADSTTVQTQDQTTATTQQ